MSPLAQCVARRGRVVAATIAVATALTSAAVMTATGPPASMRYITTAAHVAPGLTPAVPIPARTRLTLQVADMAALAPQAPVAGTVVTRPAPSATAVAHPVTAALATANARNLLTSSDGTLHAAVTVYSDCSGRTALTRTAAAIDTCIGGRTFFVGHNPGLFTPLMHMNPGAGITWFDGNGTAHNLRIVAVRTWQHAGMPPAPLAGATVQFQTCINSSGTVDRLLDAIVV